MLEIGTNSYIDVAGANEYFAERLHAESWEQADESTKEKALKQAAKEAGIKGYGKMSKAELLEALKAGE